MLSAAFTNEGNMATSVQTNNRHFLTCVYAPEVQTIGNQKITLTENHNWEVEAKGKAAKYHSLSQATLRYLNSAEGLFRIPGQFCERLPKFVNAVRQECGLTRWEPLDDCTKRSLSSWVWLTTIPHAITMTPNMIDEVVEAKKAWGDKTLSQEQRRFKFEKATREVTDTAAMYSYSAANVISLFPQLSPYVKKAVVTGDSFTIAHDVLSAKMNAENFWLARKVDLSKATPAIKEAVSNTKTYALWATAKDIAATVGGFFSLLSLAVGAAVLPLVVSATFSLLTTSFAIVRKLYSETMTHKVIDFLDNRSVVKLA